MESSEGPSAETTGASLILGLTCRTLLAQGPRAISPGADGLCTVLALTQLEARLIQLSLWDTLGTSPWEDWRWLCGQGQAAAWGWRSRKAPRPRANKRPFLCPDLSWRAARGAHGPGWGGGVAKVTPRWAGDWQRATIP